MLFFLVGTLPFGFLPWSPFLFPVRKHTPAPRAAVIAYMVALRTHLAGFTPGRVVTGLRISNEAAAIAAESVT